MLVDGAGSCNPHMRNAEMQCVWRHRGIAVCNLAQCVAEVETELRLAAIVELDRTFT
jgi:hypothetical protein